MHAGVAKRALRAEALRGRPTKGVSGLMNFFQARLKNTVPIRLKKVRIPNHKWDAPALPGVKTYHLFELLSETEVSADDAPGGKKFAFRAWMLPDKSGFRNPLTGKVDEGKIWEVTPMYDVDNPDENVDPKFLPEGQRRKKKTASSGRSSDSANARKKKRRKTGRKGRKEKKEKKRRGKRK
jgi:hypothetical protein